VVLGSNDWALFSRRTGEGVIAVGIAGVVAVGDDGVVAAVEGGADEDSIGWQAAKLTAKYMDKATFFQFIATPT
jgi:hypothetical protein